MGDFFLNLYVNKYENNNCFRFRHLSINFKPKARDVSQLNKYNAIQRVKDKISTDYKFPTTVFLKQSYVITYTVIKLIKINEKLTLIKTV